MNVALFALGLIGLWIGTDMTIRGGIAVARRLGVSEFVVGVAILSVGSDLPELSIAVSGALQNLAGFPDTSDIIVGNSLGSSLAQIGFVLGFVGLISPLAISPVTILRHGTVLIGSLVILGLMGADGEVTRIEGALLVGMYVIYLLVLLTNRVGNGEEYDDGFLSAWSAWIQLLIGLVIVIVSAEFTVHGAKHVANLLHIEPAIVAIFIIAIGTSLPELSISLGAIMRKRGQMSVGNILGSNIFDTLVPIGVAAAISTVRFKREFLTFEVPMLFVISLVVLAFLIRRRGLQRGEAAIVLAIYFGYAIVRIFEIPVLP